MGTEENKVRTDTAMFHYYLKKQGQILSWIASGGVDPNDVKKDLLILNDNLEESKRKLKLSLEEYFEYEKSNPEVPRNFLFKKLYKAFF